MSGQDSDFAKALVTVLERMLDLDGDSYALLTAAPYYIQFISTFNEGVRSLIFEALSTDRLPELQQLPQERIDMLDLEFGFEYPHSAGGGNFRKEVDLDRHTGAEIAAEATDVLRRVYSVLDPERVMFSIRIGSEELNFGPGRLPEHWR